MIDIRKSHDRGAANHGWLQSRHTFSFGDYYDPAHMGFGPLRVINEDRVAPAAGFGTHGHRDMEIVSYVIDGALQHADSLGGGSIIRPGEVQRMTAGSGVRHSEYNASKTDPVHFLQIWILPEAEGLAPGYEQKAFDPAGADDAFQALVSRDGREGSLRIHQDAGIFRARLSAGAELTRTADPERLYWLQAVTGALEVNGARLEAGDGAAIRRADRLDLSGVTDAEILLFDLAA